MRAEIIAGKHPPGTLFPTRAEEYNNTPLLTAPGVPRFMVAVEFQPPGIPKAHFDQGSFFVRAAEDLAARGRRPLAALCPTGFAMSLVERLVFPARHAHGLTMPADWAHLLAPQSPHAVAQCVRLLWQGGRDQPDSLVIADDHLVEPATRVLQADGIAAPADLEIVSHAR